jgi:hypothetical protein
VSSETFKWDYVNIFLCAADETTLLWPTLIRDTLPKEEMEKILHSHSVLPLPVYNQNRDYVEPLHARSVLQNSLVEAHFRIRHYHMQSGNVWYDCFSGIMEQVIVLQNGPPPLRSPYKTNIKNGMYFLQPRSEMNVLSAMSRSIRP